MRQIPGATTVISLGDREPLQLQELLNVQSNTTGLIIQLYAHGGPDGIAHTPGGQLIPWDVVVGIVSGCRTNLPVRLELLGVCNSKFIVSHLTTAATIDQIWITTEFTTWQSVYNNSRNFFTFIEFLDDLEHDPQGGAFINSYREIKWGNFLRTTLQ